MNSFNIKHMQLETFSENSVFAAINFVQVSNPLAAVCNVGAYMHSTNLLVATSLRNVLGTKVISKIFKFLWL